MEKQKDHLTPLEVSMKPAPGWYFGKFFKYSTALLLTLTIIFLGYQVAFLITPVLNFISILFTPVILGFLFYYLLRPLVHSLERYRIPRAAAILLIFFLIAILLSIFLAYLGPILGDQIKALVKVSAETVEKLKEQSKEIAINVFNLDLEYEVQQKLFSFLQEATQLLSQNILDILSLITRIATILIITPFIIFYLLKEDELIAEDFLNFFSGEFRKEMRKILHNIDKTLANYITGILIISSCIGGLLFFGYLLIGLNYALILSMIAFIFMSIPFLGPFIAVTPALLIGISEGSWMVMKVLIVFLIVQQLESNIISPQILGQRLNIRPLTILLLLVAAGSLYGLLGLLLATPTYAVTKVLIENIYKIYCIKYPK